MRPRARTPEELDALLEDAFVLRDLRALAALFESDALLVDAAGQARGASEIASWATETWNRGRTYVAAEPRVHQAGDTALVLTSDGVAVARRHDVRAWRYAITLLSVGHTTAKEEQ
jgi:ketosteroid isomerase-like protein